MSRSASSSKTGGNADDRRKVAKLRWGIAFLAVGAIVATPPLLLRQPADGFAFIGGRSPNITGVTAGFSGGPSWQYRVYSWEQPYDEIVKLASSELGSKGYKSRIGKTPGFQLPGNRVVLVHAGRSRTRKHALGGGGPSDPLSEDSHWVTVVCGEEPPDSWINHARLALEPDDY